MILSCHDISISFGTDTILKNVSFNLEDNEKAAIIGINGAGKSTLFKIITGSLAADDGSVTIPSNITWGYLAQYQDVTGHNTIYAELMDAKKEVLLLEDHIRGLESMMKHSEGVKLEKLLAEYSEASHRYELLNGYALKSEVTGILKGLGFEEDEFNKNVDTLSGGEKTRVALGKLLLNKPDLLLLDEPINHLDMNSVIWLENYLNSYKGAVLIVAHDRYFIDRIVNKIVEIENGVSSVYKGNYKAYSAQKELNRITQLNSYIKQQHEIAHQEEVIRKLKSFNREKSLKRAASHEKMLERMDKVDKPTELNDQMKLRFAPPEFSGNDVLIVSGLAKSFNNNSLFSDLSFEIKKGEHVAIIGDNGTGKTTILKMINGLSEPDAGSIRLGSNVKIAYYDQEQQVLNPDNTLFMEISDAHPDMDNTQIRNYLAAFLFTGDDVFKKISDLSGGEKGRLSLLKLMLSDANFIILDEPTNHLDIVSKEILEQAIKNYEGTILYVSHDRYFVNTTASSILELTDNKLLTYIGNYDYYLEKKDDVHRSAGLRTASDISDTSTESDNKIDWKARKQEQAALRKKQNDLKKLEDEIDSLETRSNEIDTLLSDPEIATNVSRCVTLANEQQQINIRLEKLYEYWETMQEEISVTVN